MSVQLALLSSDDPQEHTRTPRHDLDVGFVCDLLAKKLDGSLELPMLLATVVLLFRVRVLGALLIVPDRAVPLIPIPAFRLRPPLRAPPR